MLTIGAFVRNWAVLLLLCSSSILAQSANETISSSSSESASATVLSSTSSSSPPSIVTSSTTSKSSAVSYPPETTCLFRTINYITHTLPQQCLKTSWTAPTPTASVEEPGSERGAGSNPSGSEWGTESEDDSSVVGQPTASGAAIPPDAHGSRTAESISNSIDSAPEAETDSPFDNVNFLSFEEWKAKNLARAGQSPENVGQGRAASDSKPRRRQVDVNALDSLGEEGEIEIDFSGFGNKQSADAASNSPPSGTRTASKDAETDQDKAAPSSWALSRDAGKTCKERFNYASFDCAGTVLKTNPEAKSSTSVLVENKDSYMLNECSAKNKFFIVELCDDILVDTVVLANFEFFSSMFRHFRVSVSDRYPVKMDRWKVLGVFEARNSRELQPFLVTEPQIWARYLRVEFLTHYGNEFYCPVSLLRVHGTTMMEQFKREEEEARGGYDEEPIESAEGEPVLTASAVAKESNRHKEQDIPAPPVDIPVHPGKDDEPVVPSQNAPETESPESSSTIPISNQTGETESRHRATTEAEPAHSTDSSSPASPDSKQEPPLEKPIASRPSQGVAAIIEQVEKQNSKQDQVNNTKPISSEVKPSGTGAPSKDPSALNQTVAATTVPNQNVKATPKSSNNETPNVPPGASTNATQPQAQVHQRAASHTQPSPASPTTQESFFKSVHKRLQQLELNSTLSLQYIEEQSRILREAFIKVEKRQLAKTETFLNNLNSTVVQELKAYRAMYEQLWQSTILELEGMKERNHREIGELGARLSLVADELVFQKRMAVVQSTLLLLCLGLVLFVRSGTVGAEVPLVQQIGSKYAHIFDTPPGSPEQKVTRRRRSGFRGMWRSDNSFIEHGGNISDGANLASDAETEGLLSPVHIEFSPPTPATTHRSSSDAEYSSPPAHTNGLQSDGHGDETDPESGSAEVEEADEQAERLQVLSTQSGPATPRGSRDNNPSWEDVDRAVDMLRAEEHG